VRDGADIVIADLDEVGGKETASLVHDAGREAEVVVGDVGAERATVGMRPKRVGIA